MKTGGTWTQQDRNELEHKQTGTSRIKTGPGDIFEIVGDKVTAY